MTCSSQKFISYTTCPSNRKIVITDGTTTTTANQGNVYISDTLILKNALHVPKLSTNLVSIQKLTIDYNCRVIFHPSYCENPIQC